MIISRKPRKRQPTANTLPGGEEGLLVPAKKQARAGVAVSGDGVVSVPRRKAGGTSLSLPAAAAIPVPKKKAVLRKGDEAADETVVEIVYVEVRRTIASARIFTTLMQLLILGFTGFVAARQFYGAEQSKQALAALAAWLPVLVRGSLLAGVAVLSHCFALYRQDLHEAWQKRPPVRTLAAHFVLAIANFVGAAAAPQLAVAVVQGTTAWLLYYAVSPLLWAGYLATGFALLLPGWSSLARPLRWRAGAFGALVLLCYVAWRIFEQSSYPTASFFIQSTMAIVSWISAGSGHPITFVKLAADGVPVYRAGNFVAFIFPGCSGLEGMLLTGGLLLAAVLVERRRLRIRVALTTVLLAVCSAFLANAVRLVILFYIGDFWSPEVAETGFHANFGVVSFVCISVVFFLAMRRFGLTAPDAPIGIVPARIDLPAVPPMRLAYPLMAMVSATLLCGLFSGTFNWLYPVPALIGAVLLVRWRLPESEPDWTISPLPLAAGVAVFWLWIMIIPDDAAASASFAETLFAAPPLFATLWLLARFAGSIIVVPIAEELTFRGLLVPWTMHALDRSVQRRLLVPLVLMLNAVAFGLMHSGVAAGAVAGLVFGLVFWRRSSCRDAILAHACSNLLLCFHALGAGEWSYL